ncbi:hypothetical protein Q5P01_000408 [Channa striata]|uniref:Gasdermin PUB domain-containing protein n=1 Tax=Channa striata TaxID=64152 RepID=A0AA88IIW3_CHASR|nr:hypothetical protein Q5P01_000408 [Channa striata]
MVVDFAKGMEMDVVNTYFQKRGEHRVTYKSGGRSTQVDYILCRRGHLREVSDCKVEELPDDWETTAEVIRETGRKVLGVSSGKRKDDKDTWLWNEEVQDYIQRKRLAKRKWDVERTEESRQDAIKQVVRFHEIQVEKKEKARFFFFFFLKEETKEFCFQQCFKCSEGDMSPFWLVKDKACCCILDHLQGFGQLIVDCSFQGLGQKWEKRDWRAGRRRRDSLKKEHLLQPLADVHESTRQNLLKHLRELTEDRDHLTVLEETWDQDSTEESDCPQCVSSFMELLKTSNTSTCQKDAVHLLISAMDTLPDDLPALLTSCSPDTLRVLNQLVDSLNRDTQTKIPESLPPPLQEDGELRWVVELLCSTNQTLEQLSDRWDQPEFPPGVMLEVLSLAVRGLSLMQTRTDS